MSTVIKVENLGKKYILRHQQKERYTALRDVITNKVKEIGRRAIHPFSSSTQQDSKSEEFWALKDVSFEISQGERVGIIGRNGAGKTTLLKLLSRITEPTTGRITIKGCVASLLEVGTGFHPELTGRENIFLNGAILGMGKTEIKKKFDEIVDFAEVEKFLDTPVKRYSSGMYVRLAFAVAAHLETEILIVDEVLAVGDAQFQKKCLGKMEDAAKIGKTILFVSHNMSSVKNLCNKGIVLESGKMRSKATVDEAIKFYMERTEEVASDIISLKISPKKPQFIIIKLASNKCNYGEYLDIHTEIVSPVKDDIGIEMEIHDERGTPIIYTSTAPMAGKPLSIKPNEINQFDLRVGPLNLATGDYYIYFWLIKPWAENYHIVRQALKFSVELSDPCNSGFDFKQSYARGATTIPIYITNI
jgi:lipopolysaccharide transport system ATP-binding protein